MQHACSASIVLHQMLMWVFFSFFNRFIYITYFCGRGLQCVYGLSVSLVLFSVYNFKFFQSSSLYMLERSDNACTSRIKVDIILHQ